MKKNWFIGIDVSKNWVDVHCVNLLGDTVFPSTRFDNDIAGFEKMEARLQKTGVEWNKALYCLEHTGTHMLLLLSWLELQGREVVVEAALQIQRSIGLQRGKTDQVDAQRIAEYARLFRDKVRLFQLPSKALIGIKQLLTYRQQLVKIRTSFKNSLKSHQQYYSIAEDPMIIRDIEQQIKRLDETIKQVEDQIQKRLESDPDLKKNYQLTRSVKGIGLILAATLLVTSNNYTAFPDARKFNSYVGVAPFEHSSGSSIRGKTQTSHLGNKVVKTLLMNGANSAARYDPELRAYYQRKKQEGKDHKLVINAVAAKLIGRTFAVVKRGTPFVSTYQHNLMKNVLV